jgi:mannosyl-oligosaccharide alpha-1,2-mannosidase
MLSRLVYISPSRNLIYVTDTDLKRGYPTRRLEHLSCFLPGLLALGAHTLPLDDLPSLGIDYLQLAEGLDYQTRQDYLRFAKYNLTELHMWAAKGLTETCYMTYIDQPSGLGPDEILFHQLGDLWMDHVDQWRKSGRIGGSPPGLEDNREPIVVNEQDRYQGTTKTRQREYGVRKKEYLLLPEVCPGHLLEFHTAAYDRAFSPRQSSRCICCGVLREKLDGESTAGPSSRL